MKQHDRNKKVNPCFKYDCFLNTLETQKREIINSKVLSLGLQHFPSGRSECDLQPGSSELPGLPPWLPSIPSLTTPVCVAPLVHEWQDPSHRSADLAWNGALWGAGRAQGVQTPPAHSPPFPEAAPLLCLLELGDPAMDSPRHVRGSCSPAEASPCHDLYPTMPVQTPARPELSWSVITHNQRPHKAAATSDSCYNFGPSVKTQPSQLYPPPSPDLPLLG